MKGRRVILGAVLCLALVIAAGIRTGTGQGYSDPIVLPRSVQQAAVGSERILEVRLTNKKTGRPQHHQWSVLVPRGGAVEIECHEWVLLSLYGFSMPGFPTNSFRRIIPLDSVEEGVAGPYHFVISWRPKTTSQAL